MSSLYRFQLVDADGHELEPVYDEFDEAMDTAREMDEPVAVIRHEFARSGSNLFWTPNNEAVWPPDTEVQGVLAQPIVVRFPLGGEGEGE